MNLNIKNIVLILIAVMLASFLMAGLLGATTSPFWGWTNPAVEPIDETREFSADTIKEIDIETISSDINFILVEDTDTIRIHLYGDVTPDILPAEFARQSGNRLSVTVRPRSGINVNTRFKLTLDMYVPAGYVETLRTDTVSADLYVSTLDINTLDFKTVSGDLKADNLELASLGFKSVSGDLRARTFTATRADLRTTSGNVEISGFTGNIEAKSVSGDLSVEYREFANNLSFDTTSGKTKLTLPQDAEFSIRLDTVSGKVDSEFPLMVTSSSGRNFVGAVGDSDNRMQVKSVSGNVNIFQQ